MDTIIETAHYKIYWYDNDKTILIGEVCAGWTWSVAYDGIKILNDTLGNQALKADLYSIIHLKAGAQLLPKSGSILTNLRNLLRDDPQHEKIAIYVVQGGLLYNMMQIASKLYGLRNWMDRYRFASTLDEALLIIFQDKGSSPLNGGNS